jgi:hypothetical protein
MLKKNGVIIQKMQTLDKVPNELRTPRKITAKELEAQWLKRRAVERDLQVLV